MSATDREWTQEDWLVSDYTVYALDNGESNIFYANVQGGSFKVSASLKELIANAHLIAAAPDLYEALHDLLACGGKREVAVAEAALSKARGEKQ